MLYYYLMTANAAAMLDNAGVCQMEDTHNDRPVFRLDLNNQSMKNLIIDNTDKHSDNALYYQLITCLYGENNVSRYRRQTDCIRRSLIYLDFKSIFSPQTKAENANMRIGYNCNKWSKKKIDEYLTVLFEDGFTFIYEDGDIRTYIPFDKSGSMSRNYSITFVDKDLFPSVDQHLRLGLDFSSIKVVLSKYFAYRGLYLTDGVRIDEDAEHILNEKTVLVIDDDTHDYMQHGQVQEVPVITANKDILSNNSGKLIIIEKEQSVRLNSFDGEGLISPFFAEYINEVQRQGVYVGRSAVSFQIRMPFIKGMLHTVDFHQFFREYMPEDEYYIKDLFGISRKIDDVQIILTKSMLKCAGWLEDYCSSHSEIKDPMAWFFEMFHQYSHALYICNTDSNMGSRNTTLAYQFINTMGIEPRIFENLIKRHLNVAHAITRTGLKYAIDISESDQEMDFEDESIFKSAPAWRFALGLNPNFIRDRLVQDRLKSDENARVKDVGKGRIMVDGVLKYLSGDLLALLIHIIYNKKAENEGGIGSENGLGVMTDEGFQIDAKRNLAVIHKLKTQLIRTGKFYTADHSEIMLRSDKRYSILRSPHLSRNEYCSLRAFIPEKDDEKNVYNRYFSQLKNVVMLPYESVDALSLGGADYDGDKVKIILDKEVNSAVLKSAYVLKGKDYERKYPIVEIPSLKANREPAPTIIPYQLVKDTFSNQVGKISNAAIKIGKIEYFPIPCDPPLKNKCAECTLATGLEIDAVKTGVRPDLRDIKNAAPKGSDYYLERLDIIRKQKDEDINRLLIDKEVEGGPNKGDNYIAKEKGSKKTAKGREKILLDAEYIPLDALVSNIDRLPGYYLKDLARDWVQKEEPANKKSGREILLYKFQVDAETGMQDFSWKRKLKDDQETKDKVDKLAALIKAYRKLESDARIIESERSEATRSNYMNKIWFLLMKIFDFSSELLPVTHTEIPVAIEIVRAELRSIFETKTEVENAINRMIGFDWIFTLPEERESILYKILETEDISEESKELLLSDEPDAFDLLRFYLYEIKDEIIIETDVDETALIDREEAAYQRGYSKEAYRVFVHEYLAGQDKKESKKIWNARIIDICRKQMAAMFDNDLDNALKCCFACRDADPSRHFLWEVFTTEEILRNVNIMPKE